MISKTVLETLKELAAPEDVYLREPLAEHTTFRVGGPADCLITVESEQQLAKLQRYLQLVDIPFFVLGNGSNTLARDAGYEGIVLQVGKRMSGIRVDGDRVFAQAGALLSQVAGAALEHGLSGLEFASGIPGTVGGAVVMNAGAYGGEMSQVVTEVTVLNREGEILILDNSTMEFSYRHSAIRNLPFIVTSVSFQLQHGDPAAIRDRMEELAAKRREKQPLEYPSAGSTFKRPEGHFAGELIMKAGLKGFQIGGARVSDKHCGFIVNVGGATAADILRVAEEVRERVKERFGVELELEPVVL